MARKLQPIVDWKGFAPDADPTTPGVITEIQMTMATSRGLVAFPRPVTTPDQPARPAAVVDHIKAVSTSTGSTFYLAAAGNRLYSLTLDATTWTEITRLSAYTGSGGAWMFEGFGTVSLACYGGDLSPPTAVRLQASTSYLTRFADVGGAPYASIMVTAAGFVLLFNVNDGGAFAAADGWWCSTRYDHTNWTLAAGGSTRGRLVDSAGPITAAIEFNGSVYAFKADAIYRGDFSPGSTEVWVWTKLPFKVGCRWRYGICKDDSRIYFLGPDDLYAFDGVNLVPLMAGKVKSWFWQERFATMPAQPLVQLVFDRARGTLMLFAQNSGIITFHVETARFGRGDVVYSALSEAPPTGFDMPTVLGVRSNDYRAVRLTAFLTNNPQAGYSQWETGDLGDDREMIETTEFRLRLVKSASPVSCQPKSRDRLEDALTFLPGVTQTPDGKMEVSVNARWLRARFLPTDNDFECLGYVADHTPQGSP